MPSLFHLAPTHGKVISLCIQDVVHSKSIIEIYGVQGLELHNNGYILINNYPVKDAKIMGRVLACKAVLVLKGTPSSKDFLILELDDFLGDDLAISVRVPSLLDLLLASIQLGQLVEVTGTVIYRQDYRKLLLAHKLRIVGHWRDFGRELEWWATVLSIRRFLVEPWTYFPDHDPRKEAPVPRFEPKALRAQREKARVWRSLKGDQSKRHRALTSALDFSKDSVLIHRQSKLRAKKDSCEELSCRPVPEPPAIDPTIEATDRASNGSPVNEVIDLTED